MAKQTPRYRALVVGAGRIGFSLGLDRLREQPASHAFALAAHRRVRLAGAVDIAPEKLIAWKKHFPKTNTYLELDEALAAEKPDLVVIAVPESVHTAVALQVFSFRPRLVIMEKPVAPTLKEAFAIARASARERVPVSVNHERRFSLDYVRARKLLESGAIGDIHGVRAALWSNAPVWTKSAERNGACSLLHDGTHLVDTVRFLLGRDLVRPAIDFTRRGRTSAVSQLFFHYAAGKDIHVAMEVAGNKKAFDFEIEVTGSTGRLHIGNGFFRLMRAVPSRLYSGFTSLRRDPAVRRPGKTGYFSLMVKNCVDFLDRRAELASPLAEGIKTLEALYQVIDLLRTPGR
jgi:predicted dehydrogenase